MTAPTIHYQQDIRIERRRILAGPARILVRRGQFVTAIDPVVEDLFVARHVLLDVARGLGVSPERADQLLLEKVGGHVAAGDLLAGPVGLTRRCVRAPSPGKIVHSDHGQILLELEEPPHHLKAGLPGEVIELFSDRGVVIQSSGALVQGVWGNGHISQGKLRVLLEKPDQELTPTAIGTDLAGVILVSGYCENPDVFKIAVQQSAQGIVLASMHPALLAPAQASPIPVMIMEGFGRHPLNPSAGDILSACEGFTGALNAEPSDRFSAKRPELVITKTALEPVLARPTSAEPASVEPVVDSSASPPRSLVFFVPGSKVRLVGTSMLGRSACLLDLVGEITLPNGLLAAAATIQFPDGEIIAVPLGNLELLD